ncbi:MAG: hypothetical protein AB4372_25830 [Xenococcus sp. (in: cyanobacteria)]
MKLKFTITKFPEDSSYEQIINIRKVNHYNHHYNYSYWSGGFRSISTPESMRERHEFDSNSYFAFAVDEKKKIKAYAHFSTEINDNSIWKKSLSTAKNTKIAMIHAIAATKDIQGKNQEWKSDSKLEEEKVGIFFYKKIFNFCLKQNSELIIADVCIYPLPNLPSLIIHKKFNFIPFKENIEKKHFYQKENSYLSVRYIRLIKVLSSSLKLERLPDETLCSVSHSCEIQL